MLTLLNLGKNEWAQDHETARTAEGMFRRGRIGLCIIDACIVILTDK